MSGLAAQWLAVSGYKNAGKTTLIERLLPLLQADGLTVGVVKHDAHGFAPWPAGTDTARFAAAGATRTLIAGPGGFAMHTADVRTKGLACWLGEFASLDLVILEGGKRAPCPQVAMVREGSPPAGTWPPPAFAGGAKAWDVVAWVVPGPPLAVARTEGPVFARADVPGLAAHLGDWLRNTPDASPSLESLAAYLLQGNTTVSDGE